MFGNLFSNVINAVKNFLAPKAAAKPATPAPKANMVIMKAPIRPVDTFQKFAPIAAYNPYIAKWGHSKATIAAGMAKNNADAAARQKAADDQAAEKARAEAARRKWEAQQAFDRTKNDAKAKANASVEKIKKNEKGDFFSWVTGGPVGDQKAREFADQQLKIQQDQQIKEYDKQLNAFLKTQAAKKAEIEAKRFSSQAEFDKAVGVFAKWESGEINNLETMRATITGMIEGYTGKSQEESKSWLAQTGKAIKKNIIDPVTNNGVFKYTLGSGDENIPSVVTAPSRAVNWVGNLFNGGGAKNLQNGTAVQGFEKNKNAWTQTFNQRNFNIENPSKGKVQGQTFDQWYKTRDLSQWKDDLKSGKIKEDQVKKLFKKAFDMQNSNDTAANYVTEFFADPLALIPGGKVGGVAEKSAKWLGKAAEAAKGTKIGGAVFETGAKIAESKPLKWLGSEYKNYDTRRSEFIQDEVADIKRKNPLISAKVDEWVQNSGKLRAKAKAEISAKVLANYGNLSRVENRSVQELLRAGGDWSAVKYVDKFDDAARAKIEGIVANIRANTDDLLTKERAAGINTPQKNNYIPQYRRKYSLFSVRDKLKRSGDDTPPDWWFTKEQKRQSIQKRSSFVKSLSAREYSSKLARQDFPLLQSIKGGREDIGENIKRIQNVNDHVKKTRWEKLTSPISAPTRLWKKSVLKYNPAWTVNNVAWNLQAATHAGGAGALLEHAKLLRTKNYKKALDEVPEALKTSLGREIGTSGRLNKFYDRVENTSRLSAFRAAKAKGLNDDAALKRVNKYMFDYKIKNFERPLKAVLPFYAWNKNLALVSATMPLDRPLAAKGYHEVDQYQQNQFDSEFEKVVPELTKLGYREDEIQKIKQEQAKYFKGRLKVGNKWITTPFNPLSDNELSNVRFNPYLTAGIESGMSEDSFGNKVGGKDASYTSRLKSKFPQYVLGEKAVKSLRVAKGIDTPTKKWIGGAGSEGYGLTKEKQGSDPTKANYDRSLDPRAKLAQDALAFVGVPRSLEFDTGKLVETKKLQKATEAYFSLDTKGMKYEDAVAAQEAVFKKYGMTADDFYKGLLSKYDSANTTRIKGLKESAAKANKSLFDEYAAQPAGTRNVWATNKLRELNAKNYFGDNPFKKSFSWINPSSVEKVDKQTLVQDAIKSGDWSKYRAKFGLSAKQKMYEKVSKSGDWSEWQSKFGRSEKALARDKAIKSGDWTDYANKYGVSKKVTPYQYDGKYFKTSESMAKYKEGKFWENYAVSSKEERRQLLANNPQYNRRADWTDEQWDQWKAENKIKQVSTARSWGVFAAKQDAAKSKAQVSVNKWLASRGRTVRVKMT